MQNFIKSTYVKFSIFSRRLKYELFKVYTAIDYEYRPLSSENCPKKDRYFS